MQSYPLAVSEQPYLGELRLWTGTQGDPGARVPFDPTVALRAEVAELSVRLRLVEMQLARPAWPVRAWRWLHAQLLRLAERRRR